MIRFSPFLDRLFHAAAPAFGAFLHENVAQVSPAQSRLDLRRVRRVDEVRDLHAFLKVLHAEEHESRGRTAVVVPLRKGA